MRWRSPPSEIWLRWMSFNVHQNHHKLQVSSSPRLLKLNKAWLWHSSSGKKSSAGPLWQPLLTFTHSIRQEQLIIRKLTFKLSHFNEQSSQKTELKDRRDPQEFHKDYVRDWHKVVWQSGWGPVRSHVTLLKYLTKMYHSDELVVDCLA